LGYAGWIGCEYHPLGSTDEGLDWLREEWQRTAEPPSARR
jgi:hydroxypyruvate isomerase